MRRLATALVLVFAIATPALPAAAQNEKLTFADVTFPNQQTGVVEAGVKDQKNKPDSITCSHFTDGYSESLGYYFDFVEPAPTAAEDVLAFCLDSFDERST